jgi:hypothetical protein
VIFDTESSALSEEEKRIARRFAAKAVRGKEEAKETASQLYARLRTLPGKHFKTDRGDVGDDRVCGEQHYLAKLTDQVPQVTVSPRLRGAMA